MSLKEALNRLGDLSLIAFIGGLLMFSSELAGLLPELSGFDTLIITGLIGLVKVIVDKLREFVNSQNAAWLTLKAVSLWGRVGRAGLVGLIGVLVALLGDVQNMMPELSGIASIVFGIVSGLLAMLIEYLKDRAELPAE